jgi:CheY-like chemotaxis protein/HPt (histidine-containing phosphotransfer) domain-containing protein
MSSVRVLHIDDEADIREVVAMSLGLDPELAVRSCASGGAGLVDAAKHRPDLILLDVMMPVMDGPTTLAHLRDEPQTADIPVVFMTARAQARELEHFASLGAAGVIPKPFDPMTLAAAVRSHLRPPEDGLGAVRDVFLRRVGDDADALAQCWSAYAKAPGSAALLTRIRDIAHGLAGAGGIFGFPAISGAASTLEDGIVVAQNGHDATPDIERAVKCLLTCLDVHRSKEIGRALGKLDS